jgi:S-DNA-T family DNA segregation ATPase FtsK/SpoIIIE
VVEGICEADLDRRRPPRPVETLPDAVCSGDLAGERRGDVVRVPLGIDGASLDLLHLDLTGGDRLLVSGPARSGVSTTLEHLARKVREADPDTMRVVIAEPTSPLASIGDLFDAAGPFQQLESILERATVDGAHRWFVVIDDAHALVSSVCLERLTSARHVIVVVGGRSDLLLGAFGHWTRAIGRAGRGVLLMARPEIDGELLGARLPRHPIVPMRPGLGYAVGPGSTRLVQVAGADLNSP